MWVARCFYLLTVPRACLVPGVQAAHEKLIGRSFPFLSIIFLGIVIHAMATAQLDPNKRDSPHPFGMLYKLPPLLLLPFDFPTFEPPAPFHPLP